MSSLSLLAGVTGISRKPSLGCARQNEQWIDCILYSNLMMRLDLFHWIGTNLNIRLHRDNDYYDEVVWVWILISLG